MNFPLDQLFLAVYKNSPFKKLAWASWVTKGDGSLWTQALYQQGGSKTPEEIFEADFYTRDDLTTELQHNLERFRFPSNYTLDKHITALFEIFNWITRWEADCFRMLGRADKENFSEYHNPDSGGYQRFVVRISKNLHARFPGVLQGSPEPFEHIDDIWQAYRIIRNNKGLLKIPLAVDGGEGGTTQTDHRVHDKRVSSLLMGTTVNGGASGQLAPGALVDELCQAITIVVDFYWNKSSQQDPGYWDALMSNFEAKFGATSPHFHISMFKTPHDAGPVERLKFNRNPDESQSQPGMITGVTGGAKFLPGPMADILFQAPAVLDVTQLLMLSGYRYHKKCYDAIEDFGVLCEKTPTPRQNLSFDGILRRHATADLFFRPHAGLEGWDIPWKCVEYAIITCRKYASAGVGVQPTRTVWSVPRKPVAVQWESDPNETRRPGYTGHPDDTPKGEEEVTDNTLLLVLGGAAVLAVGFYVL